MSGTWINGHRIRVVTHLSQGMWESDVYVDGDLIATEYVAGSKAEAIRCATASASAMLETYDTEDGPSRR